MTLPVRTHKEVTVSLGCKWERFEIKIGEGGGEKDKTKIKKKELCLCHMTTHKLFPPVILRLQIYSGLKLVPVVVF